jgi:hypothetical protein
MIQSVPPYRNHLQGSDDLVTTYEATRAGFIALVLEKNRLATPYVAEARALQEAVSKAKTPADVRTIEGIETGLLAAAGLSDKSLVHLSEEDREEAIDRLVKDFLEPAGDKFVEELVFRFLLTRGDTLGGSIRNIGGVLAQQKFSSFIISELKTAGLRYKWQHATTRQWVDMRDDNAEIERSLRGISWEREHQSRTLIYNLKVPLIKSNIDICLFSLSPKELHEKGYGLAHSYIALGELKGGIDPAGADEHWKTARTALDRIRQGFAHTGHIPYTFFIGAAIEQRMAKEIWDQLEKGVLANAANLNDPDHLKSVARWLCAL